MHGARGAHVACSRGASANRDFTDRDNPGDGDYGKLRLAPPAGSAVSAGPKITGHFLGYVTAGYLSRMSLTTGEKCGTRGLRGRVRRMEGKRNCDLLKPQITRNICCHLI